MFWIKMPVKFHMLQDLREKGEEEGEMCVDRKRSSKDWEGYSSSYEGTDLWDPSALELMS